MRTLKRLTSIGLVVVAALAASITPASAGSTTTTRWVAKDGLAGPGGCNGSATAATHIQAAINASNQDDTVIVCPGTYVEQITIQGNRDGLTLKSSTPFEAIIKTPSVLNDDIGFPYLMIVDRVDDVTIRGFKTITRTQAPCSISNVGIGAMGSRRTQIRGNRVLAPGTDESADCVQYYGIGIQDIYTNAYDARSASGTLASNEIRDAVIGGILTSAFSKQVIANVIGNSVRAYFGEPPSGSSTQLSRRTAGARRSLTGGPSPAGVSPSAIYGILMAGRIRGSITDNVVQGATGGPEDGASFSTGLYLQSITGPVEVSRNLVRRVGTGILALGESDATVRGNTVTNSVIGAQLGAASGFTFRRNTVTTKDSGVLVDTDSSGNAFRDNTFSGNGGTCDDDSAGGGSHGTANTWTGNTATVGDDPNGSARPPSSVLRPPMARPRWIATGASSFVADQARQGAAGPHGPGARSAMVARQRGSPAIPAIQEGNMHGLKRMTSVGLVVVAALAASIAPASAGTTTTTRWVAKDGHAGPSGCNGSATAATHIQTAINASNQDDVVIVCPGTYVEQVFINGNRDGLTLKSSTPFGATIKAPTSLDGGLGFGILVLVDRTDDVTVRGFKVIARTDAPCDHVGAAIAVSGSRRAAIRANRVLAPGSFDGDCGLVEGIIVVDSLLEEAGDARSTSATIGFNEVRDAFAIGIGAGGSAREVTVDVVHNSVRAYFGNQVFETTAIEGTPLPFALYGIGLFERVKGVVQYNVVQGSTTAQSGGGVFFSGISVEGNEDGSGDPFANGPIDIHHNLVRRVFQGILLTGADDLTVRSNEVRTTLGALSLGQVQSSSIRNNELAAQNVGIEAGPEVEGNTFKNNTVTGSGGICDDGSSGGGSHGTANTWTGNTATVGDNPNGICPTP